MRITLLTDNHPHPSRTDLIVQHGLSMLVEWEELTILCDTGLNEAFWQNAIAMNCPIQQTDFAFISHGHKDHSGGLPIFLQQTNRPAYLSAATLQQHYFTARHTEKRDISMPVEVANDYRRQLNLLNDSQWYNKNIAMVHCTDNRWSRPLGNLFLTAQEDGQAEHPDDFRHEYALVFVHQKGLVILSPCSHCGALNICAACKAFTGIDQVAAFVGGLHFVDSKRTEKEVEEFQHEWLQQYPDTLLYTGHCTCDKAKALLLSTLPHAHCFHTGMVIDI